MSCEGAGGGGYNTLCEPYEFCYKSGNGPNTTYDCVLNEYCGVDTDADGKPDTVDNTPCTSTCNPTTYFCNR